MHWTSTFHAYVNCIDGVYCIYNYTMLWCTTLRSYPAVWWHQVSKGEGVWRPLPHHHQVFFNLPIEPCVACLCISPLEGAEGPTNRAASITARLE